MIPLGLSAADLALFNRSLSTHHSVKVTVQVLNLNHGYLFDMSDQLLDGQVTIDADAEVTRSLSIQLLDPSRSLQLDSQSPADGALFYDRMIRVVYSVKSVLLPRWVDVPIFCGPITKMSRTADVINLEAQGKEILAMPPVVAWFTKSWGKGTNRAALVRALLRDFVGETKFSIPAYSATTPGPVAVTSESNLWAVCKSVNGSVASRFIFYDGRGVLVMRGAPTSSTYTFKTGVGGNITTIPNVTYDISAVRNVVRVRGAVPKGKKTPVTATVGLPSTNVMNHYRMGRNSKPRVLLEVIEDDNMKTAAQCKALATRRVNSLALQAVDVTFDAMVAPHLEPNDVYTIKTPDLAMNARYKRATIPLKSSIGTVGYLSRRSTNKTRIRRK